MKTRTVYELSANGQLTIRQVPVGNQGWALVHTSSADKAKQIARMAQRLVEMRAQP